MLKYVVLDFFILHLYSVLLSTSLTSAKFTSDTFLSYPLKYCRTKFPLLRNGSWTGSVQQCAARCLLLENCIMISFVGSHQQPNNTAQPNVNCYLQRFRNPSTVKITSEWLPRIADNGLMCYGKKQHYRNICIHTNDFDFRDSISLRKPVQQSTVGMFGEKPMSASIAVDGQRDKLTGMADCSSTDEEDKPWWRVDLQRPYYVVGFGIVNKNCTYTSYLLHDFEVRVGNKDPYVNSQAFNTNQLCHFYPNDGIAAGQLVNKPCNNGIAVGRYFSINIIKFCTYTNCPDTESNQLSLAEVDVYGCPVI